MRFMFFVLIALSLQASAFVEISQGNSPILLTAPHGGKQFIPDIPLRKNTQLPLFRTRADEHTDLITKRIAHILEHTYALVPYVVIAHFSRAQIDANRNPSHAYETPEANVHYEAFHQGIKEAVKAIKSSYGEGVLVEIHGQSLLADALYLGTRNQKSIARLLARFPNHPLYGKHGIHTLLSKEGYTMIPPNKESKEEKYQGGYDLMQYGSHHERGIDAIQLEIGRKFRTDALERERIAQQVAKAIALHVTHFLQR